MTGFIQGPRTVHHAPSFATPKGMCDTHFHLFGDVARYPLSARRSYTPGPGSDEPAYLAMAASVGIERMVVVQASVYGTDNRCLVDAVARFGLDRARGVCAIEPDVDEAELQRLHAAGIRGVRFITLVQGGAPLDKLKAIAARIAPLGWFIQMYVPSSTWHELESVIAQLPVPVIADHMGRVMADAGPNDPGLAAILRLVDAGRAWVKLSSPYRLSMAGPPYADLAWLPRLYVQHAPERCVWATDWPHPEPPDGHMPDAGDLVDLMRDWAPDAAVRDRILAGNAATLYGFDAP